MRYLVLLFFLAQAALYAQKSFAQVTNLDNSPYNMQNSQFNMENSPYNMRNSPYNMDNSSYNASAKNGVYDNSGNRIGYEVKAPSGVTNYFDNSGMRYSHLHNQDSCGLLVHLEIHSNSYRISILFQLLCGCEYRRGWQDYTILSDRS